MKYLLLSSVLLTGCASNCTSHCIAGFGPGNGLFKTVASHYDTMDPCQYYGKPEGHQLPNYCFANAGKRVYYIRDANNRLVATLR